MKKYYIQTTFFLIAVLLVVFSILTYRNLTNYVNQVREMQHSNLILLTLEMAHSSIKEAETGHRGYHLTEDSSFLDPYNKSIVEIPLLIGRLDSLVLDSPAQQRRIDSLQVLINAQLLLIPQILSRLNQSHLYTDSYEKNLLIKSKRNMDEIRACTKKIVVAEEDIYKTRVKKESSLRSIAPITILVYDLFAIGLAIVLFFRILDALRRREEAKNQLIQSNQFLKEQVQEREFTQTILRSVLDNSPNGIMAFESVRNDKNEIEDFKYVLANKSGLLVAQLEESIIGKRMLQVMPAHKEEGLFDFYKIVVEKGLTSTTEKWYGGENINKWFLITAAKLLDGFVVTFSDITAARQQIIRVNERELLLKEAEVLANMGSWKWTLKTNEMVWSEGLSRILGNTSDEKRSWDSFIECAHPEDRKILQNGFDNTLNKLEGFRMEYRCEVHGEIRKFVMAVTAETEIEKGNILGVVVDITEMKEKEIELGQINTDLKRSNEDLEQFAYVASHDLQEPLRKIRAFGDLLSKKFSTQLEDTGSDYIMRMQSAAARMQVLIEDLLVFSRVSKSSIQAQAVNLNLLVAEIMDDLGNQILRENATFQIGELPIVRGDQPQLKRLFQNLMSNAIKFHKATVPPQVSISSTKLSQTDLRKYLPIAQAGITYVAISIEDNGIGFDPMYTEKIFDIFQRLHGRMHYEGTGIGLAICRKIVANHRGTIVAEGKENVGAKFITILPIDDTQ